MASFSEEVRESRLEDDATPEKRPRIEYGDGGDKSGCEGGDDGDKSVCEGGDDDKMPSNNDGYSSDEQMPDDLYNEYVTRLEESEGFDVPDVGRYLSCGMIKPVFINDRNRTFVSPLAELAIKHFNVKENANFEFVRLVNLTTTVIRGILLYITFEAKDADGQIKTFQAQVLGMSRLGDAPLVADLSTEVTEELTNMGTMPMGLYRRWFYSNERKVGKGVGSWNHHIYVGMLS